MGGLLVIIGAPLSLALGPQCVKRDDLPNTVADVEPNEVQGTSGAEMCHMTGLGYPTAPGPV
jgi:hypothetical protein